MDIAITLSTTVKRENGNIVYDPVTLRQQYQFVWTIETRLGGGTGE